MSYAVSMDATNVDCKIPIADLSKLSKQFEEVTVNKEEIFLNLEWEEDGSPITGKIVGKVIVLDSLQCGTYKNSSDGGLSILLTTYKGSGVITENGEDSDDHTVTKYTNGVAKKGRVVFDGDSEEDEDEDEDENEEYDDEEISEEDDEADAQIIRDSGIAESIDTLNVMIGTQPPWMDITNKPKDENPNKTVKVNKDRFSDIF